MNNAGADLLQLSIREAGAGFRRGDWSARELTLASLERIAATEPVVHAWVEIDAEQALVAADRAQNDLNGGRDQGPLQGIPVGVKDIIDVAGFPTRCGSASFFDAQPAPQDANSVAMLRKGGAVLLGKTVTQEFAAGVISAPARNPWDPQRIPGGSSGGSAVAVGLGNCFGALGSDTGGSIRIPAAACGVVGFKPTFGELSVAGVFPLSWSLDTIGPLARRVDDVRLMWETLAGRGSGLDPAERDGPVGLKGVRIGVPQDFFLEFVQMDIRTSFESSIEVLRNLGATIVELEWSAASVSRAAAFIINRAETAAVHEHMARAAPEKFRLYNSDLRLRVAAGSALSATIYLKAIRARNVIRNSMRDLFDEHRIAALIAPSLPTTALFADNLKIDGTGLDETIGASWTRLTMPFNATGQPVLAIPCGFDPNDLPVGMQLAGAPGGEASLFQIGCALESALGLHHRRPPLLSDQRT